MNSHEKASLDAWIQREQNPYEVDMYCEICKCNSYYCDKPDDHDREWVSSTQQAYDTRADALYEQRIDSDE